MRLNEVLQTPYEWTFIKSQHAGDFTASFEAASGPFVVRALESMYGYSFSFYTQGSFAMTGKGDAYRILATVIDFVKAIVKKTNTQQFKFAASVRDKGRIKLYNMLARMAKAAMGFDYHTEDDDEADELVYYFARPGLTEAIENAPAEYGAYVRARLKDVQVLRRDFATACEVVRTHEEAGHDLLTQFLKYGSDYADSVHYLEDVIRLAKPGFSDSELRFEKFFPLADMERNLQNLLQHGNEFLRFITNSRAYVDKLHDEAQALIGILHTAEAGAQQYGYEQVPDQHDTDYHAAMGLLKGLRMMAVAIKRDEALWANVSHKLGVVAKKRALAQSQQQYRPEHDAVETLFHASIHAEELARDGFQATKPEGRTGVGNFGSQETISFTHQRKVAQDISRSLKEIWMIEHGQLTARQILGWMDAEGIDWKTDSFRSTVGVSDKVESEMLPGHFHYKTRELTALKTPQEIAKLYNVYLWHTKLRTNPVFANMDDLLEQLRAVSIRSIGIVQCEVRLSPEDEYLPGESEFRVTADKVISVKRIV